MKWYNSSKNPEELSLTIKGMLVMYIPIIITTGNLLGYDLTETQISNYISNFSLFVASAMVVIGFLRKIYFWLKKVL